MHLIGSMNHTASPATRRSFIEAAARIAFGVTAAMPWMAQAANTAKTEAKAPPLPGFGRAKQVIFLQMIGGMSHIDTLDPKTGSTQGPKAPVSAKGDFQLGGYLPQTAAQGHHCSIIRSLHAKTGVHSAAQYVMRTGYEQRGTVVHPSLGAWAQKLIGPSHAILPSSVCVNRQPEHGHGFFPASFSPLPILDPASGLQYVKNADGEDKLKKRLSLIDELDAGFQQKFPDAQVKAYSDFYDRTLQLMGSAEVKAFKLSEEPQKLRDAYGDSKFGQGCLLARRLVEHGIRFVEVALNGWDMHTDLDDRMEENATALDTGLAALLQDLQSRGLLDETLVVLASEFGRGPEINGNGGRDHHPSCFSALLAGAGVKTGHIHGSSDARGGSVATDGVTVQDLHSTIGHLMGADPALPVTSPAGRPFTLGNKGQIVSGILA
jgi:hypothetical protein